MKKTYINPNIVVVKMATQQMLAGSLDPENNRGTVNDTKVSSGTAAEGREFDFFDE